MVPRRDDRADRPTLMLVSAGGRLRSAERDAIEGTRRRGDRGEEPELVLTLMESLEGDLLRVTTTRRAARPSELHIRPRRSNTAVGSGKNRARSRALTSRSDRASSPHHVDRRPARGGVEMVMGRAPVVHGVGHDSTASCCTRTKALQHRGYEMDQQIPHGGVELEGHWKTVEVRAV